jgi:hypothetical protein
MRVPGVLATEWEPDGEPVGTAYLVPGRGYPAVAPLLYFAQYALLQHGWSVRHLWWDPPPYEDDEQTAAWVREQVQAAMPTPGGEGRVLVVAKSLGTFAAPLVAERGYEAVWLTPLLELPLLVDAMEANPARQLLVGGVADFAWDVDVAARLAEQGCDVLELPDADHGMMAPGDVVRGAELHVEVVRGLDAWLAAITGPR